MSDEIAKQSGVGRLTIAFLTVMLVASVALNIGLSYKINDLTSAQKARLAEIEKRRIKPGVVVPTFSARRINNEAGLVETIAYVGNRPTVLYVFSPACGWCARNENSIKRLISERRKDYRFIGISLVEDDVEEHVAKHDLGAPVYAGLSEKVKKAYKMFGTPQTIVVSPQGVVMASWSGAYLGKNKDSVEDFFGVKLPEIELKKPATH